MSGAVVKGVIQQGIVKAYQLDSTGSPGTEAVGSAITGDDGSYNLSLTNAYDGASALLLKLTADSNTKMICDALNGCGSSTNRGDVLTTSASFDLSSFEMTAIIPAVATDAAVNAQITGFTHIAAKKIQASNDVSKANIATVTSRINQLVGTNILETKPVNIANNSEFSGADANQKRYTIMLAALADQLAKDNNGDSTVDSDDFVANLEAIANDFAADDDFGDTNGLDVNGFLASVNAEANHAGNSLNDDIKALLTNHTTVLSTKTTNGVFSPASTTGESPEDVARAKSMVADVRAWGHALGELETPANAFTNKASDIVDALDQDSRAVTEVFIMAVNNVVAAIDSETGSVPSSVPVNNNGTQIGTVTVTNNSDSAKQAYTISAAGISGVSVDAMMEINGQLSNSSIAAGDTTFKINGSAANASSKVSLKDTNITATLATDYVRTEVESAFPDISGIGFAGGITIEELNSGVTTGKKVSGAVEIKLVTLDENVKPLDPDVNFSLKKIAISDLSVSDDADSSGGLSISLEMDDANRFDTIGFLNHEPVMYQMLPDVNFESFATELEAAKTSFPAITKSVRQLQYTALQNRTCAAGYNNDDQYQFTTCLPGDVAGLIPWFNARTADLYGQSYVSVSPYDIYANSFAESYAEAKVEVSDMETAESFLDATLTITGEIDLKDYPKATLALTADKTGLTTGSFNAKLGYGDGIEEKSMELMANTTNGMADGTSGDLTFTNADGVVMKVNASSGNATSGTVMVGETVVGTMEEVSNGAMIIRYNDGTFESL